jgi:hypothetical protein
MACGGTAGEGKPLGGLCVLCRLARDQVIAGDKLVSRKDAWIAKVAKSAGARSNLLNRPLLPFSCRLV